MLERSVWLMLISLVLSGALAGCGSAQNSGSIAVPVWDYSAAAAVAE